MLYPIKFTPVYKEIIWGGNKISDYFGRVTPYEKTAESWELCARPDGMSVACNGRLSGKTLQNIIEEFGEKLLGKSSAAKYGAFFPLLIKIIDAADRLSVQVHPDDAYARLHNEKNGKNELWYIIDAKPGATLIYGLRDGVTKDDFTAAVRNHKIGGTLRKVPVKPGDAFYIPAGTVHAILDGILLAEIQQNSNTTYRIFDWDRVGKDGKARELHIGNALDVIAFDRPLPSSPPASGGARRPILRSQFFSVDEINPAGTFTGTTTGQTFFVLMNLLGPASIEYEGGRAELKKGDTVLLPACLGDYTVTGNSKLLLSWI